MARNAQILIVDQDIQARAELQKMLALSRFAVVGEAGYGVEAVSLTQELVPDLIMVRVEEPVARPLQTVEAIVASAPEAPVVVYSSLNDASSVRRAMLAGVQDYLNLPLKQDEVSKTIMDLIAKQEVRRQRVGPVGVPGTPVVPEPAEIKGTVITIFGAKGGIGKTTIATNLAMAIARESGQSVALMDMDTRFGDVAIMMDLPPGGGIGELVRSGQQLDRELLKRAMVKHPSGVNILPAPRHPSEWESVGPKHIEAIVTEMAHTFDYVILDTPGTFNDLVEEALRMATLVLLVTSMDMASIKDTVLALDMLRSWSFSDEKIKLAVNHANSANSINEGDVERTLDYRVFWKIPFDKSVSISSQLGQPVVTYDPNSKVSQSLMQLARSLCGSGTPPKEKAGGLLGFLGLRR
jgi:pilus assembly protein CpaE